MLLAAGLALTACTARKPAPSEPAAEATAAAEPAQEPIDVREPIPTSAFGGYLAARHARKNLDVAAAARFFGRALEDDPANPELLRNTLTAMVADQRVDETHDLASRLVGLDSSSPIAVLDLAADSLKRGDPVAAERQLDSAPKTGIQRLLSPLLIAWTRVGQGKGESALDLIAPLARASNFATTHDYHAALMADLLGLKEQAEARYVGAVASAQGRNLRVVQAAGSFYERTGRADKARALYESYLKSNPDSALLDAALRRLDSGRPAPRLVDDAASGFAEALYDVAAAMFQEKSYEAALVYDRLALHLRPRLDVALSLLGDIFSATGHFDDAANSYRKVPEDSPLSWSVRLRLANVLNGLGDTETASRELRAMAKERPKRADPLIALAEMLRAKEHYRDAVAVYDQAIARIPELKERHWSLLYARGMSLERSNQWPRAEADFLHALELRPDQPLVLNYLGYSWVELGRNLDQAREMIERAVSQRPTDGYVVDSLGWVLYQLGEYDQALTHLERAVELRPNDPVITDHFGDALWQGGRRAEARFQWRRALSFDPEPDLVKEIKEKLGRGRPKDAPPGDES